jgi:hypothetical protein
MKFVFPQDPSHSVSAMRRVDENADVNSGQSNRARQQDLAVVGQTVPMLFCNRHEWGTDVSGKQLGENGGVWYSPRLIGLYPKGLLANLLYLISSGEVKGMDIDDVYYGYDKLETLAIQDYVVDDNGNVVLNPDGTPKTQLVEPYFAYAYEDIPEGIDSVYQPGGSDELRIPNIRPTDTFSMGGYSFTTSASTEKLQISIRGDLHSEQTGTLVNPSTYQPRTKSGTTSCTKRVEWWGTNTAPPSGCTPSCPSAPSGYSSSCGSVSCSGWKCDGPTIPGGQGICTHYKKTCTRSYTHTAGSWAGSPGPSVTVEFYTYAKYRVTVTSTSASSSDPPAYQKTITLRIAFGSTYKLPEINLAPDTYRVVIDKVEDGWNPQLDYMPISNNPNQNSQAYSYASKRQSYTRSGKSPGNGQMSADINITEIIYNKIEYPEIPGGGDQTTGTFFDLTLAGIKGSIRALKPVDGPDQWTQAHIFVRQGVECERLMPSYFPGAEATGPSHFYGDLIAYLLGKMKLLKDDQIDYDSLRAACTVHQRYKCYFNGVMQLTSSFSEFVTRTAPYFLMTPRQVDGKYGLAPVVPVDSEGKFSQASVNTYLKMTITADEIVAGSYSRQYFPGRDRSDICLVMVYKDQPINNPGQTVTVEVRYRGTALQGPFEQHDLTDFCCHPNQALLSARYLLAKRRFTTHSCSLSMGRRGAQLVPGDVIGVDLALNTSEGTGISDLIYYQVDLVTEGQGGQVDLQLIHFPTKTADDGTVVSVIAEEIEQGQVSVQ